MSEEKKTFKRAPMDVEVPDNAPMRFNPNTGRLQFEHEENSQVSNENSETRETATDTGKNTESGDGSIKRIDKNDSLWKQRFFGLQSVLGKPDKEKEELRKRLEALENTETEKKQETEKLQRAKTLEEAFEFLDEDKRAEVIKILEEKPSDSEPSKFQERIDALEGRIAAREQAQQEAVQVVKRYNGENGVPKIEEMEGPINYVAERFPDLFEQVTLPQFFGIAELAPYMAFLEEQAPEKFKALDIRSAITLALQVKHKADEAQKNEKPSVPDETKTNNTVQRTEDQKIDVEALERETNNLTSESGGSGETSEQSGARLDPRDFKSTKAFVEASLRNQGV